MRFKLTFNRPAFERFFEGQDVGGVEVDITSARAVMFRPVPQIRGKNIVKINERARGGIETVYIEGYAAETLFKALQNPLGYPFHMLKRSTERLGWLETEPWDGPTKITPGKVGKSVEPERQKPHLRVWVRSNAGLKERTFVEAKQDAPIVLTPRVEDRVRADLRKLADAVIDVDTLTLSKAFTSVTRIDDLIQDMLPRLRAAAQAETKALRATEDDVTEAVPVKAKPRLPNAITPASTVAAPAAPIAPVARFTRIGGHGPSPRRLRVFGAPETRSGT